MADGDRKTRSQNDVLLTFTPTEIEGIQFYLGSDGERNEKGQRTCKLTLSNETQLVCKWNIAFRCLYLCYLC